MYFKIPPSKQHPVATATLALWGVLITNMLPALCQAVHRCSSAALGGLPSVGHSHSASVVISVHCECLTAALSQTDNFTENMGSSGMVVAQACSPSPGGARDHLSLAVQDQPRQHTETHPPK